MSILPSPYNTDYPDDNINLNLSDLDTLFTFTNLATMSGGLNMNSHKIMTVLDPTDLQDAATKNYVDTSVAQSNINGMNFKWYISNGAVLNSPTSVTCNQALHQFISSRYTYPLYNNKWQMTFTFPSLIGLPPSVPDDMQPPPTVGNFLLIGTQQVNFYLFNNSNAGNVSYFRLSAFNNLPIDQPFTVGDFVCILFDGIDSVLITINGTLLGRYISESPFYNAGNSILDGPVAGYYAGSTDVNTTVDNITWTMAGVYDTRQSYTQGLDFTWVLGLNSLLNTPTSITCKNAAGSFGTSLENFPLYKNKYTLSCKLPDVSTLPSMVLLTPDYTNAFYIGGSTYGWIVLFNVSGINYFSIQYNITDPLDPHPYTYGHMISIMFNGINSFSVNYAGTIYKTTVPYFNSNSYEKIRIGFRLGTTFIPITCTSISWSLNGIYDEISGAYLPLSGGTMTGVIDMGSNNITGTGTVAAGTFDVGGNVLITSPDSTTLQINNNLLPSSTTTHNLGSISKRWNNIYTNTLDTGTGVSIIVNGTITGDVQPTSINGGRLGQSTLPWLSSEITTENTKNLKIWNSTRLYNTTITSSNTSNTTIVLPVASGNSNSILINDGAGSTSWTTNYLQLSGGLMTGVIDMGNHKIIELTDPTNDQDAATKKYVDTQSGPTTQGLDFTWVLGANTTLNSPTSITCLHTSGAYGSSFRTYMFAKDSWSIECSLPDVSTLPLTNPNNPDFFDNVFYIGTTSTNVSNTGAGIICYNSTEGESGIRFALIDYHSGNISNSTTYEAGLLITIVYDGINVMYVNYKGYMFSLPLATFGFTLFNLFIGFDTIITATNVPIICDYVLWSYLGQYYMGGTGTPMLVVDGKPLLTENGGTLIGNLHAPYMYSDKFIVNGGTNQQYLLADGTVALSSLIGSNIYYYKRNATSTPLPSPTSGYISFNNIVQESATFVYINDITDDSVDISPFLNLISVGNFLYIQDRNNSANYINFTVVLKNNITGGVEISVTFLNGAGSGLTNFGINNPVYFSIFSGTSDVGTRVTTLETRIQNQTAVVSGTTFSGDVVVGTLSAGATTLSGNLAPAVSSSGLLNIGSTSTLWNNVYTKSIPLYNASSTFATTITSAATSSYPLILPTAQGSTLNILMLSNGTGQTVWSSNYVPLSGNTGNPMTGNLTVGTNTFTAGASTVGTLSAGATTLSGNLLPTSTVSVLNIGSSGAVWGNAHIRSVLVYSAAGATATTILASPSQAFNSSLTLPPLQIVAGMLYNNGTGITNWTGNIGSVNITSTGFLSIGQISTDGIISPSVTSTIDIGSLSLSFRNLYLSGIANVGSVLLNTNTTISSPSVSSAIVNNNWLPSASLTYSLGGVSSIWNNTVSKTVSVYNTSTSGTNITTAVGGSSVIPLILPATQGLSSSVLTNDGVGNTTWVVPNNNITAVINVQSNLQTKVKNTINYTNNKTTTITTDGVVATLDTESLYQQIITFGKSIQNMWVAVGQGANNSIAYSKDGINWIGLGTSIFTTTGCAVAYNGYMWVAVGQGTSTIAYSFNGINWIGLGASIITGGAYGVAWNGTMWVAGGSGTNNMAYSNDGINWTGLGFGAFTAQCLGIAWNGTIWVAVGQGTNTIAWSNDGINWTGIPATPTTFSIVGRAVTWNGTQFVALGDGTNNRLTSYNGKTWAIGTTAIFTTGYGITWSGTRYVAASLVSNTLAYSGDGITWVGSGTAIFSSQGYGVAWGGNRFIAVGVGTNTIAWSNDGITWVGLGTGIFSLNGRGVACNSTRENKITFPSKLTVAVGSATNSIVYTTGNLLTDTWTPVSGNIFGTVSSGTGRGIAWNGYMWVAVGSISGSTVGTNTIAYSYDGITWTGLGISIFSSAGFGIAWNGTMWVAVGTGTNSIAYSKDGITWTGLGLSIFTSDGQGIAWNGNLWVAVGAGTNSIAYSSNGINWTGIASGSTNFLTRGQGVSWNGYMWVAVGGGTNSILYSYNGINWNITTNVFTTQGNGVAWNGLLWVAVGAGTSCVAYSSNGINWTSIPAGVTTFTTAGQGITWNGTYWIAVGQGTNGIITSAAGITWTVFTLVNSLSGGGFGVACTQNLGSTYIQQPTIALGSGTNTLVYSADGYNYTGLGTTIFSTKGCAGVWNGSMWVAGGSGTNTFAYSYDGIKWTGLGSSIITTSVNAIAWNGSLWVAVGSGTNTIAWSNDGLTWNASTTINPFSGQGNGIAWSGTRWVAVGQGTTNTIFYSNDGKTWTPATSNPFIGAVGTTVIWTGAKFLAGGNLSTNTFAYSSDGITWTAGGATVATSLNGLACNGKLCVAVGASTPAYSTNDGITWTLSTTTPFTGSSSGVAWNGRLFIMAGQGTNTLAISGSGIKWTVVPNSSTIFTTSGTGFAVNNPLYLNIPSSLILPPSSNINNNKIDVVTDAYNNGWLDLSCSVSSKTV